MRYLLLVFLLSGCSHTPGIYKPGNIDEFNSRWNSMDRKVSSCEIRTVSQTHQDVICR